MSFEYNYFWNYSSFIRCGNCEHFWFSCNLSAFAVRFQHPYSCIRALPKVFRQEGPRAPSLIMPARLWYLQCTSSLAADEMEALTLLLATHLYWPASDRWTSVIVKVWLLFVEDAVSRELAVKFNLCSFFVHVTLGDGVPSTTQLKTASRPSTVVRSSGSSEISGATEKDNKNIKHYYNEQI